MCLSLLFINANVYSIIEALRLARCLVYKIPMTPSCCLWAWLCPIIQLCATRCPTWPYRYCWFSGRWNGASSFNALRSDNNFLRNAQMVSFIVPFP